MPFSILLNKTALAKCNKNLQIKDNSNNNNNKNNNKDKDNKDNNYKKGKKG
jgi:hypothetical protein